MPPQRNNRPVLQPVDAQRANDENAAPGLRSSNRVRAHVNYSDTVRRPSVPNTPNTPRTPIRRDRPTPPRQRTAAETSRLAAIADSTSSNLNPTQSMQSNTNTTAGLDSVIEEHGSRDSENLPSAAGSLPSPQSEGDSMCPICHESSQDALVKLDSSHIYHAHCIAETIKAQWLTSADPKETSLMTETRPRELTEEQSRSVTSGKRHFLRCPTCRGGIFALNLVYQTSQGEKTLVMPKTAFVQEIQKLLGEAKNAEDSPSLRACLVKVLSLIKVFNSIYHHLADDETTPASWAEELPAGSEPFHRFEIANFDDYMDDRVPQSSIMDQIQQFLMDDGFSSDRESQTWLEHLPSQLTRLRQQAYAAAQPMDVDMSDIQSHRSGEHRQLPPGIPSQGRQPQPGMRSRTRQSGGSRFEIGERGGRPAFFVECDGERFEALWFQILRTRTDKERGGRFILAQPREGLEDCHTTRPLSRFSQDIKTQFQLFCQHNGRDPECFTGTVRVGPDKDSLWRQTDFLQKHPLDDWLIAATWHVPGAATKRSETAYAALHFRTEASTENNTIFDAWIFSVSELRKAYDTRGNKLVDEKLAAFRTEHDLQEPASRTVSERSVSSSRSRSRSRAPLIAARPSTQESRADRIGSSTTRTSVPQAGLGHETAPGPQITLSGEDYNLFIRLAAHLQSLEAH